MRPAQPIRFRPTSLPCGLSTGRLRLGRLDDADDAVARHRILDHRQIARLEHVERQLRARQQDRAAQREHRNARRQIARRAVAIDRCHVGPRQSSILWRTPADVAQRGRFAGARRSTARFGHDASREHQRRQPAAALDRAGPSDPRPRTAARAACARPARSSCGRGGTIPAAGRSPFPCRRAAANAIARSIRA